MANKDSSLLEIAIELLHKKKKPQNIKEIVKEVMSIKGLKQSQSQDIATQFLLDFMSSGFFVYCGDDTWDLKERQPTSVLDREVADFPDFEEDEEFKETELEDLEAEFDLTDSEELEDEDDEDEEQEVDELEEEFEELIGDEDTIIEEDEYDDEDDDDSTFDKTRKKGKTVYVDDDDDDELLDDVDEDLEDEE